MEGAAVSDYRETAVTVIIGALEAQMGNLGKGTSDHRI